MKIKPKSILIAIFLFTLIFRLYFSLTNSGFSSDESYFNLRLTENIIETKKPLVYDDLSYSGKDLIHPQAFNYLLAFFSFIPEYEKIIPILLISLIVIIVYAISKKISNNETAALFSAFISAFVPIEIKTTLNQVSTYTLVIPIILLMLLCLLNLENKKYFTLFIVLSFIFPLVHPISLLFVISLLFYLILLNTENIQINKFKQEVILFSFFIVLLINFFLYKNALLRYGTIIFWQNIPSSLFSSYFGGINILETLYLIGIIPLTFGVIGIYVGLFRKKDDHMVLIASFVLSALLLMSLKLINLQTGILLISLPLLIASSKSLSSLYNYFSLTKFVKFKKYFNILFIIIILLLSFAPSVYIASTLPNYSNFENDLRLIKLKPNSDSVIAIPYEYGNMLSYYSKKKNIADSNFLLAPNVEERISDLNILYRTVFEISALEIIKKYNITYIYASDEILKKYKVNKLSYVDDPNCFSLLEGNLYEIKC